MIFVGIYISESYSVFCFSEGQEENIGLVSQTGQNEHSVYLRDMPLDCIQTSKKLIFFGIFYSFLEMFQTFIIPSAEEVTAKLALLRKLLTILTG